MKFSIALGLLFAGLASSQQLQPLQVQVDSFLRETQHFSPSIKLISIKDDGDFSTVTYQDGSTDLQFQVETSNGQMKVIKTDKKMSLSGNLQIESVSIENGLENSNLVQLPPLPLIMPQFHIQSDGSVTSDNVFDEIKKEIEEMEKKVLQDRENLHHTMEKKHNELQQKMRKIIQVSLEKETPLLGSEHHNSNGMIGIEADHPILGGEHDYNWATQASENHPLIGTGDHDSTWMAVEIEPPIGKLRGSDGHDYSPEFIPQGSFIGGGQHDNWIEKSQQFEYPLIGGDEHDSWKSRKGKHHRKDEFGKEKRHHSEAAWRNKAFQSEEVVPLLKEKLPEIMENSQIISVENKGFIEKKGFSLNVQIKNKDGKMEIISAFFKPRKQELLIDKIVPILNTENFVAVEIPSEQKAEKEEVPEQELVAPKQEYPVLLGGQSDPDHDSEFMNIATEMIFNQENHISEEKKPEIMQIPLLGGPEDPEFNGNLAKTLEEKSEPIFDVSGLALPGGDIDIDHGIALEPVNPKSEKDAEKIGLELIKKVIDLAGDIGEDMQDIEEVPELKLLTK